VVAPHWNKASVAEIIKLLDRPPSDAALRDLFMSYDDVISYLKVITLTGPRPYVTVPHHPAAMPCMGGADERVRAYNP